MSISHVIDHHCDGQTQVASDSWLIGYGSKQLNKELWKFFKSSSSRRQKWLDFLHQPLTSAALPSFQSRIHLPLVPRSQLQCIRLATKCTRSHNLSFTRDRTFFPKRIAPKIPTAGVIDKAQSSELDKETCRNPAVRFDSNHVQRSRVERGRQGIQSYLDTSFIRSLFNV